MITITKSILIPEYDTAKSFYNKAIIKSYYDNSKNNNNILIKKELYSYDTLVATIQNNKYILNYDIDEKLLFSNTTLRHIKEFLKQNNCLINYGDKNLIKYDTKKDLIKYNNTRYYDIEKMPFID